MLKWLFIFVEMNTGFSNLSKEQRQSAIQRLTALWAFTESGLGGVMHALQIPFTGLLVGGMAVIMICLIAEISENNYKEILKSAVIVLIVKVMVSPYTPFPAYIAVSFQALLGYALFSLFGINFLSIVLLSSIAMLESVIQKLLILTLFLGKSLWTAMDGMIAFLADQFGTVITNGSYWIVGIYFLIYVIGGCFIASLAYHTIKSLKADNPVSNPVLLVEINTEPADTGNQDPKRNVYRKLWALILLMLVLSVVLFFFAGDTSKGWVAVLKTISWTLSAILIWFMLIGPLFTKLIQRVLQKKESRYSEEVLKTLSFLPVLRQITAKAWQQSKLQKGIHRWTGFFIVLIHSTLTYTEPV